MSYKSFYFKISSSDIDKIYALIGEAQNYESYDLAIQLMIEKMIDEDYKDFCEYALENSGENILAKKQISGEWIFGLPITRENVINYDKEILEYNKTNKFLQWLPSFVELQNKIPFAFKIMMNRGDKKFNLNFGSEKHSKYSKETYFSFVEKLAVLKELSPLIEYPSNYIILKINYLTAQKESL
jgi:hypothetical protein